MKKKICIIGIGYVGLPLCIEFSKFFNVTGYDINRSRISSLKKSLDINNDLKKNELNILKKKKILFTNKLDEIKNNDIFIILLI